MSLKPKPRRRVFLSGLQGMQRQALRQTPPTAWDMRHLCCLSCSLVTAATGN